MRLLITLLAALSLALMAASAADKSPAKVEAKKAPPSGKRVTKNGKTYIERPTPFGGVLLIEEKPGEEDAEEPSAAMRAYEDGDTVRFEVETPFGLKKWTRKKSELDETERAAVERERRRKPAAQPAKP